MIPKKLKQITSELKKEPWIQEMSKNAEIYIVGGTVRDAFINKPMKDIDLIVDGLSISGILRILKPYGKASLEGESFAVIKFMPTGYVGEDYDIAVPREDRKVGEGHKGFEVVTDGVDVHGDLKRRDFTLNSMAINVMTNELLDPFNGKSDLENGILKATNPEAFVDDPLRILRGIQFAARFGFKIEKGTMEMMQKHHNLVRSMSGERIHDEFQKVINKSGDTRLALDLLHQTGVDESLFNQKLMIYDKDKDYTKLDAVSFFIILALAGNADPYKFYMQRMKGSAKYGTPIKVLTSVLEQWDNLSEVDKRFLVMKSISKAPLIEKSVIKPDEMDEILQKMNNGEIPKTFKDIPINGEELMTLLNLKPSQEVGDKLEQIRKAALMNDFNWKDKKITFKFAQSL